MDRKEFNELLQSNGISPKSVTFGNILQDGFCVRRNGLRWEVLCWERGKEYDVMGFPSESDALEYLAEKLIKIYRNLYRKH